MAARVSHEAPILAMINWRRSFGDDEPRSLADGVRLGSIRQERTANSKTRIEKACEQGSELGEG